ARIPTGVWPLRPALDDVCIPTGVWPLCPASDAWGQASREMFEFIVTEYLNNTKYKYWSIISILKYTKSKCQLYTDSIDNLKEVKEFVDKLREEQEERGFETALQINVASACAIKALKDYRMNQTVVNELKNNKCEEGPSKTKSMKRKNNLNEEDASSEIENSSEYDERPNKATNGIEEVISSSGASDKSNEESFDIRDWIINVLSSGKDVFKNSIITSLIPDHKFRKICEIILYDFFSMASKNPLNRYIGERKYTVERIVPLFKAIQSVYKEFMFDWIEVQLNCIKDMKTLFPNFDMTLNKANGVCLKVSSNKEVVFIEIAGGPEVTSAVVKHANNNIVDSFFKILELIVEYLN
ncbi:5463_t:CDS:10, partial [Ambispora leptoticha]